MQGLCVMSPQILKLVCVCCLITKWWCSI